VEFRTLPLGPRPLVAEHPTRCCMIVRGPWLSTLMSVRGRCILILLVLVFAITLPTRSSSGVVREIAGGLLSENVRD